MSPTVYPMTSEEYRLLDEFVSERFGLHFPEEKRNILASRLEPRLQALHLHRFLDYYLMLQYDSNEEIIRQFYETTNAKLRTKNDLAKVVGKVVVSDIVDPETGEIKLEGIVVNYPG